MSSSSGSSSSGGSGSGGSGPSPAGLRSVALFRTPVESAYHDVQTTFAAGAWAPHPATLRHVDWPVVVELRRRASAELTRQAQAYAETNRQPMPAAERRSLGERVITEVVGAYADGLAQSGEAMWATEQEAAYATAVTNAIFGYGRWQPLFEIPEAENIELHGYDSVMIQFGDGSRRTHPPVADSDGELIEAIRFLGELAEPPRPFDDAHPSMTIALGDRFRLHAIGFGLSYRPSVTIRRHTMTEATLPGLVATAMMPEHVGRFLHAAVLAGKSIVISGSQGAGKTTLLRALIAAIPDQERFGTLETDYELLTHLLPNRRNVVALQAKPGIGELVDGRRVGEYTVAELIPEALRQNLARLVVGEVRGAEASALFEALQTGVGVMCTTHSRSASTTIDRLATRVAHAGVMTLDEAYRQIAHNIDLLVHVDLIDDTWRGGVRRRLVAEIRQLTGSVDGGLPATHLTYRAEAGANEPAGFAPDPFLVAELREYATAWNTGRGIRR